MTGSKTDRGVEAPGWALPEQERLEGMFTGIIEEVGTVVGVRELDGAREVRVEAPGIAPELVAGDSVAVDGACLTVVDGDEKDFTTQIIRTTLSRTIASRYQVGSRVNLERAVPLGTRLGGHLVQGHVDGLGRLLSVHPEGETRILGLSLPPGVDEVTILHGSIAVNGVSLTVSELPEPGRCRIGIIPHTWQHTTFHRLEPGAPVNLEGDLIGKYVGRILAARGDSTASRDLTLDHIDEMEC